MPTMANNKSPQIPNIFIFTLKMTIVKIIAILLNKEEKSILPNSLGLHPVILITMKLNPMADTKMLKTTVSEAPNIPQRVAKGYNKTANMRRRTICH